MQGSCSYLVSMLSWSILLSIADNLLAWFRFTAKVDISALVAALVPIPVGTALERADSAAA